MPWVCVEGGQAVKALFLVLLGLVPFPARAEDRVAAIMDSLAELSDGLEADLLNPIDGTAPSAAAREMAGLFSELAPLHDPRFGGDAEKWRAACDQGRDLAFALNDRLVEKDWAKAREAMRHLAALKITAHRAFRPGFWRRFRKLFGANPAGNRSDVKMNRGEEQK